MKQHLYQQMHAQQRSLRNASAMHQNFMAPHYDGLPQAALNPGVCLRTSVCLHRSVWVAAGLSATFRVLVLPRKGSTQELALSALSLQLP